RLQEVHVWLVEGVAIYIHLLGPQLAGFARPCDDPVGGVASGLVRVLEHDHVAAPDVSDRQQGPFESARRRAEDELVDQEMVADQQVVLHRSGGNLERLHDPRPHEEREDHGNDDRFGIFPKRGLVECRSHYVSVPTFNTARNASCGISTRPTRFMRFLPSFCFSSSFRLRVMSPPYDFGSTFFCSAYTGSLA